jgi:polyhydroxybutyrate depolymerase
MRTHPSRSFVALAGATLVVGLCLAGCSSSDAGGSTSSSTRSTLSATTATVAAGAPVPSAGCALAPSGPVTNQRETIEVGGVPRWYLLNTPSPTTPSQTDHTSPTSDRAIPRPLVVDFHGLSEGAVIHSATTKFGVLGQKDGFDAVFPNGTGTPVQWDSSATSHPNPDLAFVTAMLDQLESTLCIDTSRVYASGLSDGSFMVSLLACTMANRFTAVAAVSGLVVPKPCTPARRVPILAFNGTADPILFFNGGVGTATLNRALGKGGSSSGTTTTTAPVKVNLHGTGFPATVQTWAAKDGCDPHSTDTRIASQIILRRYVCPPATAVEFYIILGGGHAWPGSKFSQSISSITGFTTFQINATDVIWAFFEHFRL